MTSEVSVLELFRAEKKLRNTAERALLVKTTRASRAIIHKVVDIAQEVLPVVSDFEGIEDAYDLARNAVLLPMDETNIERVGYTLRFIDRLEELAKAGDS